MSDTQKIVEMLTEAKDSAKTIQRVIYTLPTGELNALRATVQMQEAVINMLERRIAAHSNALEVQS